MITPENLSRIGAIHGSGDEWWFPSVTSHELKYYTSSGSAEIDAEVEVHIHSISQLIMLKKALSSPDESRRYGVDTVLTEHILMVLSEMGMDVGDMLVLTSAPCCSGKTFTKQFSYNGEVVAKLEIGEEVVITFKKDQ